jgi:hypothetical protein
MRLGVKVNVDGKALPQDATVDQIVEALKASLAKDKESQEGVLVTEPSASKSV